MQDHFETSLLFVYRTEVILRTVEKSNQNQKVNHNKKTYSIFQKSAIIWNLRRYINFSRKRTQNKFKKNLHDN